MEAMGMMRDLDQIREQDESRESARLVAISLGGLATACVLFAVGVLIGREGENTRPVRREDPLARLDALAGQVARSPEPSVTYPSRLLDQRSAATAAIAAPNAAGTTAPTTATPTEAAPAAPALIAGATAPAGALAQTLGTMRDPSVATTAQTAVLPVATTNNRLAPITNGAPAPAGSDGAFTLQVSSFRTLSAAQLFAQRLRERGYRAFATSGTTGIGNVTWYRVRIGPFASLREASQYRAQFEARERMPTFVVRRDEPAHG